MGVEIHTHVEVGYQPLVYSHDWMVALLNFEESMQPGKAVDIERHAQTDEVFILLKGQAALYVVTGDEPLAVVEMQQGLVYNVTKATWHNLLATRDAQFAIIENRDTDKFDTQVRPMTDGERERLKVQLPVWVQ